mmetsp:Transcript_31856/g.54341  ORF Transcript_31856/g.54341 Transcript_31856/m.54341 type:complete len:312 (-) Transcript_31856:616-1551(-)
MLAQNGLNAVLILWINVAEDDRLSGTHYRMDIVLIDNGTQRTLEAEGSLVLHASVVNVLSIKELSVTLFPPSHPIAVLPLGHGAPWSNLLADVALHELGEIFNAKGVNEVLHTGVGTNVAVAMIALRSDNGLEDFHDVLLGNESHVIGRAGEGVLLVVQAAHASSHHDIESLKLSSVVADDNATNVVGVNVQGVITRNGDADLEFTREVLRSIDGLCGIGQDDAPPIVVQHFFVNIVVFHLLGPGLYAGRLFAIKPNFRKGGRHGTEELREDLGIFPGVFVFGRDEGGGSGHDVARHISACANGGRSNVHD